MSTKPKILICDDNESIHDDFRFTLGFSEAQQEKRELSSKLSSLINEIDGDQSENTQANNDSVEYELHFAKQGEEAMLKVVEAETQNAPYSLIFMDVRMPPGIDGIQTIKLLRKDYPHLEFVICTAFSDYNWEEIAKELGHTDKVLFVPKPFDPTAIKQIALSQTIKFALNQENQAYSNKLETMVEKRTEQLKQQLEEIKNMQETLVNQEKLASLGTMTAGIAHELKNPLHFISNFSDSILNIIQEVNENIKTTTDQEDLNELTELMFTTSKKIKEHAARANSIIESMLIHSRGEGIVDETENINNIINKYLNLAYVSARSLHSNFHCQNILNLDTEIKDSAFVIQDMGRVFINILSNSYYSMSEKAKQAKDFKPRLEVNTKHCEDAFEVIIKDNGEGISDEKLKHIFDPFYTTKPTGVGTGLGLSISYDIITNQHQGSMICKSQPGEWTEFTLRLPYLNHLQKRNVA
ncbi:MAG: ATP-binding protein [Bdellovibrionales bacterium]|nr:ATP-binding protein [Bdellovibrionales bacterium]